VAALAVVAFACLARPVSAQGIGARGGVNVSNISFSDPDVLTTEARVGWVVGGFVTFRPEASWGLQVEGQIASRVVRFESAIDDTMMYLEVPVLLRVPVYRGDTLVVRGLGGVSANYLLKAEERAVGGDPADIKGTLEPWEVAVVIGADAELKGRWIVGGRYFYGLTQVYREHADFPAHQQGFQITAGYRFR
jgi:hypothetical protein